MRRALAYGAALALLAALLAGCGGGQKVAAHVNKDLITEDEYYTRVQNVTAQELYNSQRGGGAAKAGEYAMRQMITERIILQLAKEKNALPTDAQVDAYLAYAKRYPALGGTIATDPVLTDADRKRIVRLQLSEMNLAKAPLNLTDADLKKAYDDQKTAIAVPDKYHLRIIDMTDKAKSQQALEALKKQVAFEVVASQMSDNLQARARGGDLGEISANDPRLPVPIADAVKTLKAGEYTQKPVILGPPAAPQTHYVIVQLADKTPGRVPAMDEVRPYVEAVAIQQKDMNVGARLSQMVREALQKADIQVSLKPYADLGKKMKDEIARAPQPIPGGAAPPAAAPPAPGGAASPPPGR